MRLLSRNILEKLMERKIEYYGTIIFSLVVLYFFLITHNPQPLLKACLALVESVQQHMQIVATYLPNETVG